MLVNLKSFKTVASLALIFIFNCFLATLFSYYKALKLQSYKSIKYFYAILILFVSVYNSTKVPENDLEWIVELFNDAEKYPLSIYITLLTGGKEILYCVISYLLYFICGGNDQLFVFSLSFISYSALFAALFSFNKAIAAPKVVFLTSVLTMAFFPYSFALSVHIVRQFMGTCLCIWGVVGYICYHRRSSRIVALIVAILSIFVHTSVGFFIPLLFLPFLKASVNRKNVFLYGVLMITIFSFTIIANYLLPYFEDSVLSYGLDKLAEGTTFETHIPTIQLLFVSVTTIVGLVFFYSCSALKHVPIACLMMNINLLIYIFVITNISLNIEMSLRYLFDILILLPFIVSILFYKISNKFIHILLSLILFIFWSFYNMTLSEWTYKCSDYFPMYTIFNYIV